MRSPKRSFCGPAADGIAAVHLGQPTQDSVMHASLCARLAPLSAAGAPFSAAPHAGGTLDDLRHGGQLLRCPLKSLSSSTRASSASQFASDL